MSVIDLTNERAIVEADGRVRCINCIEGRDYWQGCAPIKEILVSQNDLEDQGKLYICDYCEQII